MYPETYKEWIEMPQIQLERFSFRKSNLKIDFDSKKCMKI